MEKLERLAYINAIGKGLTYKPLNLVDSVISMLGGSLFGLSYQDTIEECPQIKTNSKLEKLRKEGNLTIKAFYEEVFNNAKTSEDVEKKISDSELFSVFQSIEKTQQKVAQKNSTYGKIMIGISIPLAFLPVVIILSGAAPWAIWTSIGIGATFAGINLVRIFGSFIRNNEKEVESSIFNQGSKIINEAYVNEKGKVAKLFQLGLASSQNPDLSLMQIKEIKAAMNNNPTFSLKELQLKGQQK